MSLQIRSKPTEQRRLILVGISTVFLCYNKAVKFNLFSYVTIMSHNCNYNTVKKSSKVHPKK